MSSAVSGETPTADPASTVARRSTRLGLVVAIGAAHIALLMAVVDRSVRSLAVEAAVAVAREGRMTAAGFADGLRPFLLSRALPTGRWTKGLKAVADLGAPTFAREAIVGLLRFEPHQTPRDIGRLLELCYELHVDRGATLGDEAAIECPRRLEGGGKVARFRKALLDLT